jgi:hypothetical protein
MNLHELSILKDEQKAPSTIVNVSELGERVFGFHDRTLLYGYTCDRDTFHVYLKGGHIHRTIYRSTTDVVSHVDFGRECDGTQLVPDKRVYAAPTDFAFARMLIRKGVPFTFTTWDDDMAKRVADHYNTPGVGNFFGKTLEDFEKKPD